VSIKVYTASKLTEAQRWRDLREAWPEVDFVARWPFMHVGNVPDDSPSCAKVFWQHDLADVAAADVVLVYGAPEHHLRGALVETGMAIALGKWVIVVGEHEDYGTWRWHPLVYSAEDLASARVILGCMAL
jgi:nucleoside 2-deoxyribosyltransferase